MPRATGHCAADSDVNAAAVAAYRASLQAGRPLSERKLAGQFGKTSGAGHVTAWPKQGRVPRQPRLAGMHHV